MPRPRSLHTCSKTEPQNQTWIVEVLSAAARDAPIDGLVGESLRYLEPPLESSC